MLSKILHRKPAPQPASPEETLKAIASTIKNRVEPRAQLGTNDVDFFVDILQTFDARDDAKYVTDRLLDKLASNNTNTSYIEPYVEAAYRYHNPARDFLGNVYAKFALENNPDMLVYKMLDDRFYTEQAFPVHSFALLGQAGGTVPQNVQEKWLFRALASNVSVETLAATANTLKLDPNGVKDKQHRTILHNIMDNFETTKDPERLSHLLSRAKSLGLDATPDIFGRRPEDFGSAQAKRIYAQYFATPEAPKNALAAYLSATLHQFSGVHSIHSQDISTYVKSTNPVHPTRPTTLFQHVFESNDMAVIAELHDMVLPRTAQHSNFEKMLPYVFLEGYVCGKNPQPHIAQAVFDMMLEKSPRDLSTALGYLLMRSDNYYKNYDVSVGVSSSSATPCTTVGATTGRPGPKPKGAACACPATKAKPKTARLKCVFIMQPKL